MSIIKLEDKLYLGNVADAGDAGLLSTLGLTIVVLTAPGKAPHLPESAFYRLAIAKDGSMTAGLLKPFLALLLPTFRSRAILVADEYGGLYQAAFVLACLDGLYRGKGFTDGLAWVASVLPKHRISKGLIAKGKQLYP